MELRFMGGIHSAQDTENTREEQTGLGCGGTDPGRLGLNKRHGGLEHI